METRCGLDSVQMVRDGDENEVQIPAADAGGGQYLQDFLAEIAGRANQAGLTTEKVLHASRVSLLAQKAADEGQVNVPI